jgi:undecaprenyl-diphosphatase
MQTWQHLLERAAGHPLIGWVARIERMTLAAVILAAGLLLACAQLANLVSRGGAPAFDEWLIVALRTPGDLADPIGPRWLEEMMRDFTALGSTGVLTVMVLAIAGFLAMTRKSHAAILVLVSVTGGVLIGQVIKWAYARPRPDLVPHGAEVFTASFPSGHSMMSAVVYLTLGALLARTQPDRLTVLVGASRVYLGVHWPTDVLAGWALGGLWALICLSVMQWLQARGQVEGEGQVNEEKAQGQASAQPRDHRL